MRAILALAAIPFVLACTPLEQCQRAAQSPLRATERAIVRVAGNIDRGYAIHKRQVRVDVPKSCTNKDGEKYTCWQSDWEWEETPVSIDVAAEKEKLAGLNARRAELARGVAQQLSACSAAHPS